MLCPCRQGRGQEGLPPKGALAGMLCKPAQPGSWGRGSFSPVPPASRVCGMRPSTGLTFMSRCLCGWPQHTLALRGGAAAGAVCEEFHLVV